MSAHAPGPWRAFSDGSIRATARGDFRALGMLDPGYTVARVYGVIGDLASDARLIAAAPDLLEALQAVAARWDSQDERDAPELGDQIRKALTKALPTTTEEFRKASK